MKTNKKKNMWAAVFAVALFLMSTVTVTAIEIPQKEIVESIRMYYEWEEEEPIPDPPEIPPGESSATGFFRRVRFVNLLPRLIGYGLWIVRLCDSEPHSWHFEGNVTITYMGGATEVIEGAWRDYPYSMENPWVWSDPGPLPKFDLRLVASFGAQEIHVLGDIYTENGWQRHIDRTYRDISSGEIVTSTEEILELPCE